MIKLILTLACLFRNTYVAMGAGAVALGFIVWWLTGAPAEAKTTHHSHPTSK